MENKQHRTAQEVLDQEAEERRILEERRRKRRQKEARDAKIKVILEVLFLTCVVCCFLFYYVYDWFNLSKRKLDHDVLLNATTQQVSQLIDNVRTVYSTYTDEKTISMKRLLELGAVPESIMYGKEVFNLYGGEIVIEPSKPLENVKEAVESPTFKMVYRGLPHDACVNLALLNWGDKVEGLLAVAIGSYDGKKDTAMEEIDAVYADPKPIVFRDKRGRMRRIVPPKKYQLNVAKPGDDFIPTPFSKTNAENGCSCSRMFSDCSFAWRYTVFAVDNPRRMMSEEEIMSMKVKEKLQKRLKEQQEQKNETEHLHEEEIQRQADENMKSLDIEIEDDTDEIMNNAQ